MNSTRLAVLLSRALPDPQHINRLELSLSSDEGDPTCKFCWYGGGYALSWTGVDFVVTSQSRETSGLIPLLICRLLWYEWISTNKDAEGMVTLELGEE